MTRVLYSHRWMALREGLYGEAYLSTIAGAATGVVIVPVLPSKLINLVVETSYVDGARCLGLPAGTIEGDEPPEQAAKRELQEETALQVLTIEALGTLHVAQRYADLKGHVFLAHVEPGEHVERDEPYEIENRPLSWGQIDELIRSGELTDSTTVAALLLARQVLQEPN